LLAFDALAVPQLEQAALLSGIMPRFEIAAKARLAAACIAAQLFGDK
jgi:hypothetical protein